MNCNIEKYMNSLKIAQNTGSCMKAALYKRQNRKDTFSKGKRASKEHRGQINMKTVADLIAAKGTNVKHSPFNSAGLLYL
jgi:hypothetical protein